MISLAVEVNLVYMIKNKLSLSFVIRCIVWLVLNYSFVGFASFYEKHTLILHFAYALNTFLTANLLISIGRFLIISLYNRKHANHTVRGNFVLGISRVARVFNAVMIVITVMIALGIDPKEFVTSMTIVAMAIAVIFREYITNMISGLLVMFSDQFSIGDHIKINNYQGKIVDITLANIVVRDEDDDVVLIPNNLIFTSTMVNKSSQKSNKLIVKFELPLEKMLPINQFENHLEPLLKVNKNIIWDDVFKVKVAEVGKDFVKYKIDLTTISSSNKLHYQIQNEILNEVLLFTSREN
ncbi:mechanosensitive ion channel family protein [Sphingobacterium sp. SRCM116780]|uniref:mechanosensitive ion channel family protein n=1 Tax=Sphingobacterium sp. SRCM116780 TaxID=2907623 RepID=UPI001F18772A|nr:mechanosensitive ion channel domain-containing protein [Sphingobacterium sp. SRCM116780]UIR57758.1 mechanosensitive ion channel family protein [Sphingobacterium sp. SRCM116780]